MTNETKSGFFEKQATELTNGQVDSLRKRGLK